MKNYGYDDDFYAWALHNAKLIREKKFSEIDFEHVAEEIESMGRSDKRELINRLALLLAHLLKWQVQPERRCTSWKYTIDEQRLEVKELLEDSPSLKYEIDERLNRAYQKALLLAAAETGMGKSKFPTDCPYTLEEALNQDFFQG